MSPPKPNDELELGLKMSINWGCLSNGVNPCVIDCHLVFFERELEGECRLVKTADLSLDAVWAEWVISVWPPLLLEEGMCTALSKTQPKVFEETFLLTLHQELSSGNIDIPLQILKWQLPLLSKVKLIRSSRPTGCCLVPYILALPDHQHRCLLLLQNLGINPLFFFFFFFYQIRYINWICSSKQNLSLNVYMTLNAGKQDVFSGINKSSSRIVVH